MILILTDRNDVHADFVEKVIAARGLPYRRFNLDVESLTNTSVTFFYGKWQVIQDSVDIEIQSACCVWNRRTFVELLLDENYDQTESFKLWKNEWNKTLLGIYSCIRSLPWLNPWRSAYAAENKYLQMELALKHHLSLPDTLISNRKEELLNFAHAHNNRVALKLMHQDFYKGAGGVYLGLYVNLIGVKELQQFQNIGENPIVLQQYIDKSFEVRYTVVGDEHFVCRIESQRSKQTAIDWRRYDIPNTPHYSMEAPVEIKENVKALMSDLGIEYGALDFVVNETGEWVFLEVNSMGQFLWIEDLTGLKISAGIVNWFEKHLKFTSNKPHNYHERICDNLS
jgi:hypothetical protein